MHRPIWKDDDKDKLEKVLLELWPNSKINPRKMWAYQENLKGFYPELVNEAINRIVATQEFDRRPTISKIRKECQMLVRSKHEERNPQEQDEKKDCDWCGYWDRIWVGLYIESPERCIALDIKGKNVLILKDGWAIRPDWGKELNLTLKQYTIHCPHCSSPSVLGRGISSALRWNEKFTPFTEFRCSGNGYTDKQHEHAYTVFQRMISPRPTPAEDHDFEGTRRSEDRFHKYLESLPNLGEFRERKMNFVGENPTGREEETESLSETEATQGEILPTEDKGLS